MKLKVKNTLNEKFTHKLFGVISYTLCYLSRYKKRNVVQYYDAIDEKFNICFKNSIIK